MIKIIDFKKDVFLNVDDNYFFKVIIKNVINNRYRFKTISINKVIFDSIVVLANKKPVEYNLKLTELKDVIEFLDLNLTDMIERLGYGQQH